jgi:hypothetical protein
MKHAEYELCPAAIASGAVFNMFLIQATCVFQKWQKEASILKIYKN